MSEILDLIFTEIAACEDAGAKLRASRDGVGKQTDLEVAILKQQVGELRAKNARAAEYIDKATGILEKLKK
ncbi:MAG: hypothetical protein FWF34_03215 [Alphaproteobacteria bacterium]|nr:hypothetical protein [Alphaproteobacteria bacterium]MCL2890241.1 hypothetical protein [Alphaproteobacteria bacterium]